MFVIVFEVFSAAIKEKKWPEQRKQKAIVKIISCDGDFMSEQLKL